MRFFLTIAFTIMVFISLIATLATGFWMAMEGKEQNSYKPLLWTSIAMTLLFAVLAVNA